MSTQDVRLAGIEVEMAIRAEIRRVKDVEDDRFSWAADMVNQNRKFRHFSTHAAYRQALDACLKTA